MLDSRTRLGVRAALLGATLLAVAAHATEPADTTVSTAPPAAPAATAKAQTEVRERATHYWKARVARDPSVVDFYPPPDKRPERSRIGEGGAVRFDSFEIAEVAIEGDSAAVTVNITSHIEGKTAFPIPDRLGKRTLTETWSRIDGTWYKQPSMPAMRAAADDLQRAFLRRRAAEAAAAEAAARDANKTPDADAGAPDGNSGSGPGPEAGTSRE